MSVDWITAIAGAAISTPAIAGLLAYLGNHVMQREKHKHESALEQLKASYVTELENYKDQLERSKLILQADVNKTIFVTKVHFKTEFKALKEIFALLADLRFCMAALHPTVRIVRENETSQDRKQVLKSQLERTYAAYDALLTASAHMSPFYPEEIYQGVRRCLEIANKEDWHIKLANDSLFTREWAQQGELHVQHFGEFYNHVSNLIRERISKLAIMRNP